MADKNFARSGTAGEDFLADDDPLSELARLVGYEPRPVQPVVTPLVEPVEPVRRHENPVLALEDELMRAFEQYDAPRRRDAVARPVEPVFSYPEPEPEDRDARLDAVPTRADAAPAAFPVEEEPYYEAASDRDAGLLLADEVESALDEVPAVEPAIEIEPPRHAGHAFAERLEPRFEEQEPAVEPGQYHSDETPPQTTFLGLQPAEYGHAPAEDVGVDLERELELSIGADFAEAMLADLDVSADAAPLIEEAPADAEPFQAPQPAYAEAEPRYWTERPQAAPEEHARRMDEAGARWQETADEDVAFEPEPAYAVETVEPAYGGDDHDALLAEVERFPVPETRSPFSEVAALAAAASALAAAQTAGTGTGTAALFGRATPLASRETPRAEPVEEPVAEAVAEPVAEPQIDFENFELDLSDIELDLDPAELEVEPITAVEEVTPARRPEPVAAVPVSVYTTPQPLPAEPGDGALPFDPTMIADTDEGVAPVTELDVPQLPAIEKEKPPVAHSDYDFDIDAEMAQLFSAPQGKPRVEDAGVAAVAHEAVRIAEVDDFERALEEDFRRSLHQPERMAIPVDPGRAEALYAGDGYEEARPPARRGLLLAASVAALALIGGGGLYAWMSLGDGAAGSGEPRVILADKEPVKVVPEEKGGKTVPNQDKAVYDRVAGNTDAAPQQDQLVTSTEEPVDVVQRTLTPETLPFDGPEDDDGAVAAEDENRLLPGVDEPATAETDNGGTPLVSPRKVRTMIVKPDGTLVAREETVSEPVAEPARVEAEATATAAGAAAEAVATLDEAARLPTEADTSLRAGAQTADAARQSALAEVANVEVEDTAPVRTVKTTPVGGSDDKAPIPEMRPADQPVTVVGTVTENGNVAPTRTAEATPAATPAETTGQTQAAAATPGGYVIQIASLPSEAEAQKSYNTLSAKFSSVIGGRGVDIRKAEVPNKGTYFRVRIPAGSREDANALCNRYKSAGGSCLVTR